MNELVRHVSVVAVIDWFKHLDAASVANLISSVSSLIAVLALASAIRAQRANRRLSDKVANAPGRLHSVSIEMPTPKVVPNIFPGLRQWTERTDAYRYKNDGHLLPQRNLVVAWTVLYVLGLTPGRSKIVGRS